VGATSSVHEVHRRHSSSPTPNPSRPRGCAEATGSTTTPPQDLAAAVRVCTAHRCLVQNSNRQNQRRVQNFEVLPPSLNISISSIHRIISLLVYQAILSASPRQPPPRAPDVETASGLVITDTCAITVPFVRRRSHLKTERTNAADRAVDVTGREQRALRTLCWPAPAGSSCIYL
jgi:hypothetical protein